METSLYTANILYLCPYTVRDILHLRILTIITAVCLVSCFYNESEPLLTVVGWNLFLVALNAFQLPGIMRERASCAGRKRH